MKSDIQLKQDIEAELIWDPKVNAAQIAVSVDQGAVTLFGAVDTYADRWAAEDATKRVAGVRALAQELTVKLTAEHERSDTEIAAAAINLLEFNVMIPKTITLRVQEGAVTLEGEAAWNFQRDEAEKAVRYLPGVKMVFNCTTLKSQATIAQVKENVEDALQRQAAADASSIHIEISSEGKVTLTGHATSWQSIEDAAHAAWASPGVTSVVDQVKMQMATS